MAGVISDDDVSRSGADKLVKNAMSPRVVTIGPEEPISRAANMMRGHSVDCLIVTDRDSRPVGIITTTDLLGVIGRIGHPERMTLRDRGPRRRRARI
jgi:CBS domain-containing protein